jgi:SAM-dependent methyltransferase
MAKNEIPLSLRTRLRKGLLGLSDRIERHYGMASKYEPPKQLSHQYGVTNDVDISMHFFRLMLNHGNLSRTSSVLDVGSGAGRNSLGLRYYLQPPGFYEGFDIMPEGIDHCVKNITPSFPNFRFKRVDVFNSYYNPTGKVKSSELVFPYEDSTFDLIISSSVMTHMRPVDARQYVEESARVLKPSGTIMHTFFVVDAQGEKAIKQGIAALPFQHEVEDFRTTDLSYPEAAIAMSESSVRSMYGDAGLNCEILPAEWSRGENPATFQNVVLGKKRLG